MDIAELLAFSVYSEGDFEGARKLYKQALSIRPQNPRMHFQFGKTLRRLGQIDVEPHEVSRRSNLDPVAAAPELAPRRLEKAAEAGKHVYGEKPTAATTEEI